MATHVRSPRTNNSVNEVQVFENSISNVLIELFQADFVSEISDKGDDGDE